ncbi:hypothetical protein DL96DRAFT_1822507 [Flagelloscypha sp. PMI_526]|nr:hypothetical protein DL96DRAFT_1822507 [Flagelloscypha sp. PMI_526]
MDRSDSHEQAGRLPIEILEHIICYLSDDLSTLAACSLSSSILLPACRTIRFHTVTACPLREDNPPREDSPKIPPFTMLLEILHGCPSISQYVRRIRILDPENHTHFGMEEFDAATQSILPRLINVTHAVVLSRHLYGGVVWSECSWVLDALGSLPALQSITAEVYGYLAQLSTSPSSQKIRGLMLTAPIIDEFITTRGSQRHTPHALTTFRLPSVFSEKNQFLFSKTIFQSLNLSKLSHLAIGIRYAYNLFGTPLSSLAIACALSLKTLAFEISEPRIEVVLASDAVPNLKQLWLVFRNHSSNTRNNLMEQMSPWLDKLLLECRGRSGLEVTIFFTSTTAEEKAQLLQYLEPIVDGISIHYEQRLEWLIWTAFYDLV